MADLVRMNRESGTTLLLITHNLALASEAEHVVQISEGGDRGMSARPPLPDLSKLSDAQKDELIVSLWQTLIAAEGDDAASGAPVTTGAGAASADELRGKNPQRSVLRPSGSVACGAPAVGGG